VRAHAKDRNNTVADMLAKHGREHGSQLDVDLVGSIHSNNAFVLAQLKFANRKVECNPREFMKKRNRFRQVVRWKRLNRNFAWWYESTQSKGEQQWRYFWRQMIIRGRFTSNADFAARRFCIMLVNKELPMKYRLEKQHLNTMINLRCPFRCNETDLLEHLLE